MRKELYDAFVEKRIFTDESPWLMAIKAMPIFLFFVLIPLSGIFSQALNTNQFIIIGSTSLIYIALFSVFRNYFFKYFSAAIFFGEYYSSVGIIIIFIGLSIYLAYISLWTFVVQIALIVLAVIFVYTVLFGNKKVRQK